MLIVEVESNFIKRFDINVKICLYLYSKYCLIGMKKNWNKKVNFVVNRLFGPILMK